MARAAKGSETGMKLSTSAQMREIDRYVIEDVGVPGAELMSNAAEHIALAAIERLTLGGSAAVFCGSGNNGGDGIGAAAFLLDKGVHVRAFIVSDTARLTPDARVMLERLSALGGRLEVYADTVDIVRYLNGCDVIIDAMFGTGLNSDIRGDALAAVGVINDSNSFVISADIASGVDADTGVILSDAVDADMTVTFSMAKPGHFVEPGCTRRGELRIRDIGVPREIIEYAQSETHAVTADDIMLPRRRPDSHKGDYGRCLITAGSVGYTGAPALSARAATKMGAGLVFLGVPETIYSILAVKCDEEMPFPLPADSHGRIAANAASELLHRAADSDAVLLGPGLGRSAEITELVTSVMRISKTPIVLDADGINAISGNPDVLDAATCPIILTPHVGEFVRLTGSALPGNRLQAARNFATKHGCTVVLKGHRTITALPDGAAYINTTGGPAMAKGGSGDVLAGMITSLVGQRWELRDAVITAVYLHGLAGDMCAERFGEYSVSASDIIAMIPQAVKSIQEFG